MEEIEYQVCSRCGKSFPKTEQYFPNKYCKKVDKRYLAHYCRECDAKWYRERYQRKKETILESQSKRYQKNKEKIAETNNKWRANNKEKVREIQRRHYANHPNYFKERYHSDPMFKFVVRMRNMINASFTRYNTYKPKKNVDVIGIPSAELRDYLLQTFKNTYGYEWDMNEEVHIDHIIPLATANSQEDIARLCHYTNLRLIKAHDNLSKGAKTDYAIGQTIIREGG